MSLLLLSSTKKKPTVPEKLTDIFGASSIVEIWPFDESSGTVANGVVNGYDGSYTGVDLANDFSRVPGAMAPYFDGASDYVSLWSPQVQAGFNGALGTAGALIRPTAGGLVDGIQRHALYFAVNTTNYVSLFRSTINNRVDWRYTASGGVKSIATTSVFAGWRHFSLTWSSAADEVKAYSNGVQSGATGTGMGAFVGNIVDATTLAGASAKVPTTPWLGYLSYAYLLNRVATAPELVAANLVLGK